MEAETQTEKEQVNIIEPSDPITPMDIGNFASGTDSMDSDAKIENHERQLEQTLLEQLKIAKSVAEAKQFCTTDLDDFDTGVTLILM
jgi:hypothetical protein